MNRVLIIEDDEDLREGLAFSLAMDGCVVRRDEAGGHGAAEEGQV